MKKESEFRKEFFSILADRAYPILRELKIKNIGRKRIWTREYREKKINDILVIAEELMMEDAKIRLHRYIYSRRLKRIIGPQQSRGERIYNWAKHAFPKGPILYAFWKKNKCIYIGTGNSYKRIGPYKKSKYLYKSQADSLEIWSVRSKTYLHFVECLACHIFQPIDNLIKPKRVKYDKHCLVCQKKKAIHSRLESLLN